MFIGQILWVASNKNTLKQISTKTRKKKGRKRGGTGTEGGREGETVKERKKWKRKGEKEKAEEGRNLGINDFRYSRIQEYKI